MRYLICLLIVINVGNVYSILEMEDNIFITKNLLSFFERWNGLSTWKDKVSYQNSVSVSKLLIGKKSFNSIWIESNCNQLNFIVIIILIKFWIYIHFKFFSYNIIC